VIKNQLVVLVDLNVAVNALINPVVMDPKNVAANAAASVLIKTVARVINVAAASVVGTCLLVSVNHQFGIIKFCNNFFETTFFVKKE